MYVKNNATDADGSALVSNSYTGGTIAWTTDLDAVQVTITSADFGASAMEIGGSYYVYLGLSSAAYDGVYLEPTLKSHLVEVYQDGIRS